MWGTPSAFVCLRTTFTGALRRKGKCSDRTNLVVDSRPSCWLVAPGWPRSPCTSSRDTTQWPVSSTLFHISTQLLTVTSWCLFLFLFLFFYQISSYLIKGFIQKYQLCMSGLKSFCSCVVENPCKGICSHLCLLRPGGYTCACPQGSSFIAGSKTECDAGTNRLSHPLKHSYIWPFYISIVDIRLNFCRLFPYCWYELACHGSFFL